MPNSRPDHAKISLARRVKAFGGGLRRLVLAGVSARAEAVMPTVPPRDRR